MSMKGVSLTPRWPGGGLSADPLFCPSCREVSLEFRGPCEVFGLLADRYVCPKCKRVVVMSLRLK